MQNLPFTEPMLAIWAQLVSLAGSKLEKQRMKKSLSRGLTGRQIAHCSNMLIAPIQYSNSKAVLAALLCLPPADQVDIHLLRCQQLRLYILKAGRALLPHQDRLRQILCQPAVVDMGPNPSGKISSSRPVWLVNFKT